MRSELTAPLRRVLEWLMSHRDANSGALRCSDHKIEHTGKSAGAVVLAVELAKYGGEGDRDYLFSVAKEQCERIASRLEREGNSTCFTFRPGRHDPYNCSNSVIDGGACSDALAACVMAFGERLTALERERFTHASVLHAQTYLRYAIVDKGVPAQCAWAMTGAAQAYRLSGHEVLKYACEVGAQRLAELQRPDGSVPYHPVRLGAAHPGAEDASAYYQSRVHAFTDFALRAVHGVEGKARSVDCTFRDYGFADGLDFLHGLQGPDGIKVGGVEAKPWYWGAHYEVASHPFDIAAFAAEWRRSAAPRAQVAMLRSWRAWLSHLLPSGEPTSHVPDLAGTGARPDSYQCSFFWAAHACWIARCLPELESALDAENQGPQDAPVDRPEAPTLRHFKDVDLVRLDSPSLSVWIRGKRPPGNAFHGSPLGGGIIRVHDTQAGRDLFNPAAFVRRPEAAWSGRQGLFRPRRGWQEGRADLKFSGWLMRNRWRGGDPLEALLEPVRTARRAILSPAGNAVSTAFDRSPDLSVQGDGTVHMVSRFAHRDGAAGFGRVERTMRMTSLGLDVHERCLEPGGTGGLWFRAPQRGVLHSETNREVRYSIGGHRSEGGAG